MRQFKSWFLVNKFLLCYLLFAIIFCIVTIAILVLIFELLGHWRESDLSSWVQAVATIFAVISGFSVTIWKIDDQRIKQGKQSELTYQLTFEAVDRVCDRLNNSLRNRGFMEDQEDKASGAIEVAQTILFVVYTPMEFQHYFFKISIRLDTVNKRITKDKKRRKKLFVSAVRNLRETRRLWNELNQAMQASKINIKEFPEDKYDLLRERLNSPDPSHSSRGSDAEAGRPDG